MADPEQLRGVFRLPFPEQVAFFRAKLGNLVPTRRWDDMLRDAHDQGFMVAGAMQADLLADLGSTLDTAIAEGGTLEQFEKDFPEIVRRHGWTGWTGEGSEKGRAWRMRTIFLTNMRTSYAAGRHAQLVAGKFNYWVYRHGGSMEPRPDHLSWNGLALPPDHPFWRTHYPPSDWGCSCSVRGAMTDGDIKRLGGEPDKRLPANWRAIDPKTGAPVGIGRGWDYAPGASVVDTVNAMAEKMTRLPALIGAQFGASIAPMVAEAWRQRLTAIRAGEAHKPVLAGTLHADDVIALEARGTPPASAEMLIAPGIIRGPKADRHLSAGNALDEATWDRLPELLLKPLATLIDERTGSLIYLLAGTERFPQIAVEIDYVLKPRREGRRVNLIKSAYFARSRNLLERVRNRELTLIRGTLEK